MNARGGGFLAATPDDPRLGTGLQAWFMEIDVGDCVDVTCWEYRSPPPTFEWRLFIGSDHDPVRGEGWYLYDSACGAANALDTYIIFFPEVEGSTFVSACDTSFPLNQGAAGTYLSYVGPDRISGFAYYDVPQGWESPDGEVVYHMTFDVRFQYHNVPASFPSNYYLYDGLIPYDTAWPWDQITDPAIRDLVYEWYKPE